MTLLRCQSCDEPLPVPAYVEGLPFCAICVVREIGVRKRKWERAAAELQGFFNAAERELRAVHAARVQTAAPPDGEAA